jgi:hypothetical protein
MNRSLIATLMVLVMSCCGAQAGSPLPVLPPFLLLPAEASVPAPQPKPARLLYRSELAMRIVEPVWDCTAVAFPVSRVSVAQRAVAACG